MFRFRIKIILLMNLLVMMILFLRLSFLQYYKGDEYNLEVRNANIIEERLEPLRGSIYDTNGKSIAEQVPSFNLILNPNSFPFTDNEFVKDIKNFRKKSHKLKREDRKKEENELIARLSIEVPRLLKDPLLIKLNQILKKDSNTLIFELTNVFNKSIKGWLLEPLFYNLKYEEAISVEMQFIGVRGINIESSSIRSYPQGWSMAHIIGQIQNLQEDEVDEIVESGKLKRGPNTVVELSMAEHQYLLTRHELANLWVGRSGLEASFNRFLSGVSGESISEKVIVKNAEGEVVPEYINHLYSAPVVGGDLHLTIDVELQKIAENAMRQPYKSYLNGREVVRNYVGAFIALNPQTGEVLALVSMPDFDPNALIPPMDKNVVDDVLLGKTQPSYLKAFNRVTQSRYPPGSPFKIFVALMGLEDNIVDENFTVLCTGAMRFASGDEYRCHNISGHQRVDIIKALKKSCNIYFYTIGMKMGTDRQNYWSKLFGFGQKTGLELPREYAGHLPVIRLNSKKMPITNLYVDSHYSIGQVDLETTPIQMARAVAVFANGGYLVSPHIVKNEALSKSKTKLPIKDKNIKIVVDGLFEVVNTPGGTAYATGHSDKIEILGKTGTADVGGHPIQKSPKWNDIYYRPSQSSYPPHAWFVGFAPRNNPKIAFACVSEHSGHGGEIAAPIVKKILEDYIQLLQIREENEPKG